MSKKSRKRNKKILGALAAGLGAMALMKRKKAASVASSDDAGLYGKNWISKKAPVDTAVAANAAAADTGSGFQTRFTKKVDGKWMGPMEYKNYMASTAGNRVPPSMRGGALHAEGYQRRIPGQRHYPGGWEGGYSMRAKGGRIGAKKGGRVTGIAKRGFGRALMKGKK